MVCGAVVVGTILQPRFFAGLRCRCAQRRPVDDHRRVTVLCFGADDLRAISPTRWFVAAKKYHSITIDWRFSVVVILVIDVTSVIIIIIVI